MLKELLNARSINIYLVWLKEYRRLGLDEVELVILMNLFLDNENGIYVLKFKKLTQRMSISVNECEEKMQGLMNKGFVEIRVEYDKQNRATEYFDLNPTLKMLEKLYSLEAEDEKNQKIISMIEHQLGSALSPNDINVVLSWKSYSYEEIMEADSKALANGVVSVNYINSILRSQERLGRTVDEAKSKAIKDFVKGIKR